MEAARFIAVHVWNSAGASMKRKQFDPHKLLPFSWDKDYKPEKTICCSNESKFIWDNEDTKIKKVEKQKSK